MASTFVVAIVAPAGFGQSELVPAWLLFARSEKNNWAVVAVAGVAATQVAGTTLHNFLLLRTDGETVLSDPHIVVSVGSGKIGLLRTAVHFCPRSCGRAKDPGASC